MKKLIRKLLFYDDITIKEFIQIDRQIIDKKDNLIKQYHLGTIDIYKKEIFLHYKPTIKEQLDIQKLIINI